MVGDATVLLVKRSRGKRCTQRCVKELGLGIEWLVGLVFLTRTIILISISYYASITRSSRARPTLHPSTWAAESARGGAGRRTGPLPRVVLLCIGRGKGNGVKAEKFPTNC